MEKINKYGNFEIDGNYLTKGEILNLYRLQKQLLLEENIVASLLDCKNIWFGYSGDLCASWLDFPKNDVDILPMIKSSDYFVSFDSYLCA